MAPYLRKEQEAVEEYINNRVQLVVTDLCADTGLKLRRTTMAQESKRKLFLYGSEVDGPIDWHSIKKRRLNVFGGSGPGFSRERLALAVQAYEEPLIDKINFKLIVAVLCFMCPSTWVLLPLLQTDSLRDKTVLMPSRSNALLYLWPQVMSSTRHLSVYLLVKSN